MKDHIHNTSIYVYLMNGPSKLESYITLGWKGMSKTNTLAYWAHSKVTKKMKSSELSS